MEDRGKLKVLIQPAAMSERVGVGHSSAAGILLSSENSRSVSAPITAPDRRPAWRAVLTSSTPPGPVPVQPERSISPESNDSISEELNHFKPIVCSPCTPPKRLPDGRLLEPAIVKSTPRNLSRVLARGPQRATSYEASAAVLQKWRQIERDRQNLAVDSKATLTSPPPGPRARTNGGTGPGRRRAGPGNQRRLLFDPSGDEPDLLQKIRGTPEPRVGRNRSFTPAGFQPGRLAPKEPQSPKKDGEAGRNQNTSRRGKKRRQKTKHLDPEPRRARVQDQRLVCQVQQDRALALKLQRQWEREPDQYFLRSWMSTQNRRRRGSRRSRRTNKKL